MKHAWIKKTYFKQEQLTVCKKCGIVQRADKKNNMCKGIVKITLRNK